MDLSHLTVTTRSNAVVCAAVAVCAWTILQSFQAFHRLKLTKDSKGRRKLPKAIAVFGTATDVGKSIVCTALCRILSDEGYSVAPFKAQNMSNNSFVTLDGHEIGRAQAAQAEAARCEPTRDMNPVLLKPSSDTGCQVILSGKPLGNLEAREYFRNIEQRHSKVRLAVKTALSRLQEKYDIVVLEGAGSCAELNLKDRDVVNFSAAELADADVILVADIEKCGVFAQVIGTIDLLTPAERRRVKGIIINKFRGDPSMFDDGVKIIEQRTKIPILGVVPYFRGIHIDSEDALPREAKLDPAPPNPSAHSNTIYIAVLYLPHISNFTDFLPLSKEPNTEVHYLQHRIVKDLRPYHAVILPGSKNVRFDLDWLRKEGWAEALSNYYKTGKRGQVVGICGGLQMMGREIADPMGYDGAPGTMEGLGFVGIHTEMKGPGSKTLRRASGTCLIPNSLCKTAVSGYEIHLGSSSLIPPTAPAFLLNCSGQEDDIDWGDGAVSPDNRAWGSYLHGLFDSPNFRRKFLSSLRGNLPSEIGYKYAEEKENDVDMDLQVQLADKEAQYNALASHFRNSLDLAKISLMPKEVPKEVHNSGIQTK